MELKAGKHIDLLPLGDDPAPGLELELGTHIYLLLIGDYHSPGWAHEHREEDYLPPGLNLPPEGMGTGGGGGSDDEDPWVPGRIEVTPPPCTP